MSSPGHGDRLLSVLTLDGAFGRLGKTSTSTPHESEETAPRFLEPLLFENWQPLTPETPSCDLRYQDSRVTQAYCTDLQLQYPGRNRCSFADPQDIQFAGLCSLHSRLPA